MAAPPPVLETQPLRHAFPVRAAAAAFPRLVRIPAGRLEQLCPGIDELEISMRHSTRARALDHGEAYVLSLLTAYLRPRRIFEIGTASGQATLLMARQAPDARIDTLDLGNDVPSLGEQRGQPPWTDLATIGEAFRDTEHAARITQHFGDSARFDFAPFAGQINLVLIDGAHTYEYVASDSRAALAMLAPGGAIVWDDCNALSPGVAKALLELRRAGHPIHRVVGTRFALLRTPSGG